MPQNVIIKGKENKQQNIYTHDDNYLILFCLKTRFNFFFISFCSLILACSHFSLFLSIYLCRQKDSSSDWLSERPKMKIKSLFFWALMWNKFFLLSFSCIFHSRWFAVCCWNDVHNFWFNALQFFFRVLQIFFLSHSSCVDLLTKF